MGSYTDQLANRLRKPGKKFKGVSYGRRPFAEREPDTSIRRMPPKGDTSNGQV